ncbi:GumC family protein [Pedobacter deserti]|uniref:GumC family protein n=1 Tax=Pedobacter deserti TaxID=2817382 RepID=UPI00210E31CA|nr:tyrosine-protein kinase [Pedobacter sp. SYSU D00382]
MSLESTSLKASGSLEDPNLNFREIIARYLYHWPVFVIGIILSVLSAYLYLRYTKPVYQISSTLLIKDEKKGGPSDDILNQLDLFGSSKVVENEVEILQSKTLMAAVVKRLNLSVDIHAEGRVLSTDLYKNRPVNFQPFAMNPKYFGKEWKLTFPEMEKYQLENVEDGQRIVGALNQLQKNFIGTYKIDKAAGFVGQHDRIFMLVFNDPVKVVNSYLSKLSVSVASKQSTVLLLTFNTTVPERGKDILNTLVSVYNEAGLEDKNRTTQSSLSFIDERLKLVTGELVEVEKNVEGFKSSRGLTDISSEAALYLENVKANDVQLNEVNLKLGVIKGIKKYIESDGAGQEKLPSTLGIDDPVLLGQISQLSELQLKKVNLLATTQPNNPIFGPINDQIAITRATIRSTLENIEGSLENTKRSLDLNNSQYEGSIKKIPGQEREFLNIKRQATIKESLYLYLLQKKEEAALSYASSVADSRVVDSAYSTTSPIKPKKQLTYLVCLIIGLLIPVGYIYTKDLVNNKVSSIADISKATMVPVLGELMYEEGSASIVVEANSRRAIAEQFRSIRTNLQFIHGKKRDGRGNVTLLTSSMSGEGKSFVSSNIAATLAMSGRKTVLLELDLRKPKVSKYLELDNQTGLSNYLIGKSDLAQILRDTPVSPNLKVIGSGPVPPNPSELLIGQEVERLIEDLRGDFDEIIIDTPPIGLVTDAQILARMADATVYIVRYGVTFKDQIKRLDDLFKSDKFPKPNIILNGIKIDGNYGYGYGYGYGYYSDDVSSKKMTFKSVVRNVYKRF